MLSCLHKGGNKSNTPNDRQINEYGLGVLDYLWWHWNDIIPDDKSMSRKLLEKYMHHWYVYLSYVSNNISILSIL
jgi:hypothetical protein